MTSAQVKNTNVGLMELIGNMNSKLSINNTVQDFSKVMQEKTGKVEKVEIESVSPKKEIVSETQPDSKLVTSKASNTKKLEKPVEPKEEIEEGKLQEFMQAAVVEVEIEIAKTLDISVEELEQVMEILGVSETSLLDATQLPTILAGITGEDILSILTNEELSNALNELIEMVNEKVESLANEFEFLPEDITEMAKIQEQPNDLENTGIQEIDKTFFVETLGKAEDYEKESNQSMGKDAKVVIANEQEVVVEVANNDASKNETQKDMSGNSNANSNDNNSLETSSNGMQNFTEIVIDNIEHAVNEITYTQESMDTEGIMKQIVNHVKIGVGKEVTSMELQLHPESLGKLNLQVAMKDGTLVAKFTTENETVKNVIEGQLIQLKETLEAQGLKVTSVEVSVAEQGLRQNLSQNSGNHGEFNESKESSVRKINLQGIKELDDIELGQMNEEEQIATKMMLENGNTVDFTA